MIKEYDINTIGGRLLFLIQELRERGITDSDGKMNIGAMARSIGINESQFSRVTRNDLGITLSQIMEISSLYKVRTGWLIEGEEPVFKKEKSGSEEEPDYELLTQIEKHARAILQLSSGNKQGGFQPVISTKKAENPAHSRRANTSDKTKTDKKPKDR